MTGRPLRDEQRAAKADASRERTEAERLRTAEITLATLRDHAERNLAIAKAVGESRFPETRGYDRAMRMVMAILDSRWLPEGQPVIMPGPDEG